MQNADKELLVQQVYDQTEAKGEGKLPEPKGKDTPKIPKGYVEPYI